MSSTDDKLIGAKSKRDVTANRANDLLDVIEAYQQAAVHTNEPRARPTLLERTQRGSDQVAAIGRVQSRIVAMCLDVANLRAANDLGDAAEFDQDDLVVMVAVFVDCLVLTRGGPTDRLAQTLGADRLHHIVNCVQVKGIYRVIIVCGNKYHSRWFCEVGDDAGQFQAIESRHLDIAEQHINGLDVQNLECLCRGTGALNRRYARISA